MCVPVQKRSHLASVKTPSHPIHSPSFPRTYPNFHSATIFTDSFTPPQNKNPPTPRFTQPYALSIHDHHPRPTPPTRSPRDLPRSPATSLDLTRSQITISRNLPPICAPSRAISSSVFPLRPLNPRSPPTPYTSYTISTRSPRELPRTPAISRDLTRPHTISDNHLPQSPANSRAISRYLLIRFPVAQPPPILRPLTIHDHRPHPTPPTRSPRDLP